MPSPVRSFHDDHLTGIVTLPGKRCLLLVRSVDGTPHQVLLSGVERLRVDEFREGNVILDLEVVPPEHCDREDALFGLLEDGEPEIPSRAQYVERLVERLRAGDARLVRLNPSYGCSLACVCSGLEVDPVPVINVTSELAGDGSRMPG